MSGYSEPLTVPQISHLADRQPAKFDDLIEMVVSTHRKSGRITVGLSGTHDRYFELELDIPVSPRCLDRVALVRGYLSAETLAAFGAAMLREAKRARRRRR